MLMSLLMTSSNYLVFGRLIWQTRSSFDKNLHTDNEQLCRGKYKFINALGDLREKSFKIT